ncbi:MAG: hypothetical protein LBC07_04175 [Elusimicrobiota bacterium]|jgi:hypothetical protein|nr:hypothetical protein [Elusimicrobiota bacterium]
MDKSKKVNLFKYMSVISIACGVVGIFFLLRGLRIAGLILVGVWAALYIATKVLLISMKKVKEGGNGFSQNG